MANGEVNSRDTWEVPNEWEARQPLEDRVGGAAASVRSPINTKIQEYMLTDAAQSVMQTTEYGHEMVKWAIERLLMKEVFEKLTGENILSEIFIIEEEEEGMKALHASRGEEITANEIDGHETEGFPSANEPSGDQEKAKGKIKSEYQELHNATLCKICHDKIRCVVFLPCGHLATCSSCAPNINACPVCGSRKMATANAYFDQAASDVFA